MPICDLIDRWKAGHSGQLHWDGSYPALLAQAIESGHKAPRRLEDTLKPAGLDWITALRAAAIRKLAEEGTLSSPCSTKRDLAEIHLARLSRRAAHALPQSVARRRACAQTA
jgi:hypothetical protein